MSPDDVGQDLPRPEYPRPHRVRQRWLNLNGTWEFAFDDDDRGRRAGWESGHPLPSRIRVPFTFEAPLSGIGDRGAHPVVWYRRCVELPGDFLHNRVLLHVGACDFTAQVWVNGRTAGTHRGGYTPFACEVQELMHPGINEIVVRVEDHPVWTQPRGKQIVGDQPAWIDYDRVTGIWQTVWLEPVPDVFVADVWSHFRARDDHLVLHVLANSEFAGDVQVTVRLAGNEVAATRASMQARRERSVALDIPRPRLWSVENPVLYDVTVALENEGTVLDSVETYAGLRTFGSDGRALLLNGTPLYFRGVLDQGYFPGGWYTAASDADLRRDVELVKALGFNGVRKHQKVEDPRWLYWCDRLGLMVWSEMANGRDFNPVHVEDLTREWSAVVRRDRMHPSIVAWVPLNESWGIDAVGRSRAQQEWVRALYHLTKSLDTTRPVVANDGWQYFVGDLWGLHLYLPEGEELARQLERLLAQPTVEIAPGRQAALPSAAIEDVPVLLTECGGIAFHHPQNSVASEGAWGYAAVTQEHEFAERLGNLVNAIRHVPALSGFVWTQFTDVQQEINGLLSFDRVPKLPLEVLRQIFDPRA